MSVAIFLKSGLITITNPSDKERIEQINTPSGTYTIRADKEVMQHILNLINSSMDNSEYVMQVVRLIPDVVIIGRDLGGEDYWVERNGVRDGSPTPSVIGLGSTTDAQIAARYIEVYIDLLDPSVLDSTLTTIMRNLQSQGVLPGTFNYIDRK